MPRLVPQLVKAIAKAWVRPYKGPLVANHARQRKSLQQRPILPTISLHHIGRYNSILLDNPNPISRPSMFRHHKAPPPALVSQTNLKVRRKEFDAPRAMNESERNWWSNPYRKSFSLLDKRLQEVADRCAIDKLECCPRRLDDVL